MKIVARIALSVVLLAAAAPLNSFACGQELGTITFPNSGSAAAQAAVPRRREEPAQLPVR